MKTIGYGLIQIPIVTRYRVCCIKRTLAGGVTSTGWQEIIGCALRLLLLSVWGLKSIDYSLPQTAEKLIGVYIEFGILTLLLANGVVVLFALWSENIYLLHPAIVIIPVSFMIDIIVKGTCYAALFLTPKVTSFGVLSLVEVWFRGLSLMYGWIIIISYIYYKRKDWKLTEVDIQLAHRSPDRPNTILRKNSSKSPFSRHSSISQRGKRSFLLRKQSGKSKAAEIHFVDAEPREMTELTQNKEIAASDEVSSSARDVESEVLLGDSATMSLTRSPGPRQPAYNIFSPARSDNSKRAPPSSLQRSPPRYKKRGGFVPEVLRTLSKLEDSNKPQYLQSQKGDVSSQNSYSDPANTIGFPKWKRRKNTSGSEQASLLHESTLRRKTPMKVSAPEKSQVPPPLPTRPPIGSPPKQGRSIARASPMSWFRRGKEKPVEGNPLTLEEKHVPEPVLV